MGGIAAKDKTDESRDGKAEDGARPRKNEDPIYAKYGRKNKCDTKKCRS